MNPFKSIWHEIGKIDPLLFKAGGKNHVKVSWTVAPPSPGTLTNVRVIVTPNDNRLTARETTGHTAVPVVVVEKLDMTGFVISAFNPDGIDGEAGFDFLAVAENPLIARSSPPPPPEVRFGIGQPKALKQGSTWGDWNAWAHNYSSPLPAGSDDQIIRLLTAHNFGETGLTSQFIKDAQTEAEWQISVARQTLTVVAVGVTSERFLPDPHQGMAYSARNVDAVPGKVGWNWLALKSLPQNAGAISTGSDWMVDSSFVRPLYFQFYPNSDAFQHRDIRFSRPFNETPAVFLTGFAEPPLNASNLPGYPTAVVGTVFNATRFGFTLGARNVEAAYGQTGLFWVAVGCGVGCG